MSIRFRCKSCRQLLGIANRKAGASIRCPKCGFTQVVPAESTVLAMTGGTPADQSTGGPEMIVCDESSADPNAPAPADTPPMALDDPSGPAMASPAAARPSLAAALSRPEEQLPSGMILYPRQTLYIQGFLFVVVAAVAFGAGYFIGRGDATYEKQVAQQQAARQRVPVEGKLLYDSGKGKTGDANSVVILLPEGKPADRTLSHQGIGPQDPPPAETHRNVEKIRKLGGAYARTGADGSFYVVVPDQGYYHVLIISGHANRPIGQDILESDLVEMEKYFSTAKQLVGRWKYRWTREEIRIGFNGIEHNFGADGKK